MDCVTAGTVMVQLFLQTQPRFELTNKKLQYLLCISQIARLSYNKPLFDEEFKNLKQCFSFDSIANNFVYNSAIVEGKTVNKPAEIKTDSFIIPYNKKKLYSLKQDVCDEDKATLVDVFVRFGSYKEQTLCSLLNEFKELKLGKRFDFVPKQQVVDFLNKAIENNLYAANEILSFVKTSCEKHSLNTCEHKEPESEAKTLTKTDEGSVVQEPVVKTCYLDGRVSLESVVINKKYSVLVEVDSKKIVKDVCVVATNTNDLVAGSLKKISDTLYSYSFLSVPSNLRISVKYV